jgi:hypothetical protein
MLERQICTSSNGLALLQCRWLSVWLFADSLQEASAHAQRIIAELRYEIVG